uniref:MFS domain-containing protein n=1 Tax=Loa loa TaxID=7209 RepID=A0A1I7VHV0_LOALO
GIAYGADFAAIGVITVRWASLKQNGLCESSFGWPAVYYVHAAFGIFIFTIWVVFYRDQPEMHKNVSGIELEKIRREKSEGYISSEKYVPYLAIIKNPAILIVWLNAFVEIVSALFLLSYGPTYIKYVLNISVEGTGFLVALQGLSFLPFRIAAGFMSDQIKCMNEYRKMIFFNTLSLVGASVFYCILGFIAPEKTSLSVFTLATAHAVMAFNVGGFYKCGTFVARLAKEEFQQAIAYSFFCFDSRNCMSFANDRNE